MSERIITEWLIDPNTCFLLGAGCSSCAGKPLMSKLTEIVQLEMTDALKKELNNLKGRNSRPANIEDLINFLLQKEKLLSSQVKFEEDDWSPDKIRIEIKNIQHAIVKAIGTAWDISITHLNFFRRFQGQSYSSIRDIFSLNYDTLLEACFEELKLPYTDGFRGSENAYFESRLFDISPSYGTFFKLFKLHGSINWIRDNDDTVRRRPTNQIGDEERVVLYPTEQKYIQTQYGIYETLLGYFRKRLKENRQNNKLVVLGYSFNDEHINVAIVDSILAPESNLTVYAFVGPENDQETQIKQLSEMVNICDNRLNFFVSDSNFIGKAFDETEWESIKNKDLWKFENLVKLFSGGNV